jgi:signal transduction histidine kinase/ketosteroid isomerase-like protein
MRGKGTIFIISIPLNKSDTMKLSKKQEAEIMKVYEAYWQSYLKGDITHMSSLLAEEYTQVGSAESEVFFKKKDAVKFLHDTVDQVAGKLEMRNRVIKPEVLKDVVLVSELTDIYVLAKKKWVFYSKFRASTLMQKKKEGWKITHQHTSFPDTRTDAGENISIKKIAAENLQLREAVKRRTIELEQKNRELEIETALEKVRAIAMGMKEPADMPDVCKTISLQLQSLGVKEIRNVQTAIFYVSRGTYMNYEYYAKHKKTIITETSYTNHKIHKAFAKKMLHGKGEFYITHIKGKKVKDWIAYQKTTNVFIDRFLEKAGSLNYYWHSLGPVALGTSTYSPLSKEELNLFNRFLNVFELAYTRYLDIEQALAQVREAQIEASLERVRAIAMSMMKPDELLKVCESVFNELRLLGFTDTDLRNAQIIINNDDKGIYYGYQYSDNLGGEFAEVPYDLHPTIRLLNDKLKQSKEAFADIEISGAALKGWKRFVNNFPQKHDAKLSAATELHYYFYSVGIGALGISSFKSLTEEKLKILQRLRNVFNLSYQRYTDIALAEAQAREAQIEAGMERLRSKTMAMQHSDELREVVAVAYHELEKLDFDIRQCVIAISNKEAKNVEWWSTGFEEKILPKSYIIPFDNPFVAEMIKDFTEFIEKNIRYRQWELAGEKKKMMDQLIFEHTDLKNLPEEVKMGMMSVERLYLSDAYMSYGMLEVVGMAPLSPDKADTLQRFANVFEQTYTRFLDLQKAEAQARESQIQLALERVRARTMAMQHSEELAETASEMFKQIQALGMHPWACGFNIFDKDEKAVSQWMSLADGGISPTFRTPLTEDPFFISIYEARQRREELLVMESSGAALEETYRYMFSLPDSGKIFGDIEKSGFEMPKFQITHCAYFSQGYLVFITYEPVPESWDIFKRFASVFEQTYTRFLDLQKAEAQAKESQIQLALERVRARTMAMQRSDELKDAAALLFQQAKALGVPAYSCGYNIWEKNEKAFTSWMSTQDGSDFNAVLNIPLTEDANFIRFAESKKKGEQFFVLELRGERMQEHYQYLKTIPAFKAWFDYAISVGFDLPETQIHHLANFSQGNLLFITLEPCLEFHDVFKRFAAVFEQTYTRFLDLQKAEAQAREAQIELGLERVRARAMAMQKSEELSELVDTVFKELTKLDFALTWCIINIIDESSLSNTVWAANPDIDKAPDSYYMKFEDYPFHHAMMKGWKERKTKYVYTLEGREKKVYDEYLFNETEFRKVPAAAQAASRAMEKYVVTFSFSNFGGLQTVGDVPLSDANLDILSRFGKVFDLTYTRFNDLKLAEAQAREAQIETALERVRSRSMGMQKSEELKEVIQVVYEQFVHLNIKIEHTGFVIDYKARDDYDIWIADPLGVPSQVTVPYFDSVYYNRFNEAKEKGEDFFATNLSFEEKNRFYQKLFEYVPGLPEEAKKFYFSCPALAASTVLLENVCLYIENFSGIPYTDEENNTLMRFGKVFQQTYTRFLDLQKAEAQAREAQIETALERVRSRSMGMQKSEELREIIQVIYEQFIQLGIHIASAGFATDYMETDDFNFWFADAYSTYPKKVHIPYLDHPQFNGLRDAKLKGVDFFANSLTFDEKNKFIDHLLKDAPPVPQEFKDALYNAPGYVSSHVFLKNVVLYILNYTDVPFSDAENAILIRFGKAFEQAYIRFLDLQKAEAQAREAKIETSLERMRSVAMSIRKSEEMILVAESLYKEMRGLGITNIRNAQIVIKIEGDEMYLVCVYSDDTAEVFKESRYDTSPITQQMYDELDTSKEALYQKELTGKEFEEWLNWRKSTATKIDIKLVEARSVSFCLYSIGEGHLGISAYNAITGEQLNVLKRFRNVFELSYRRFMDVAKSEEQAMKLQQEKERLEYALNELQTTQKQLIQSEKMASLGELTAGIAHEIQNPLNFVNNFSEVSNELLDEMMEEVAKGNYAEVKAIADDVKQNLEKINHHGKRADGIVKGMLQHSRSSSGIKEPTDINALADEYLRLAYHGLRAKDKSFNATLKTDYDETIGKISVIPQDIGRAVLNLITNAFYAVTEKKKKNTAGYEPTVSVATKKTGDKILISVKDNGNGIPQKILDKIFQPFFTTKPTGQGTGLGLSLSYDIVKAHGGELKVETKENVGSEFIIILPIG